MLRTTTRKRAAAAAAGALLALTLGACTNTNAESPTPAPTLQAPDTSVATAPPSGGDTTPSQAAAPEACRIADGSQALPNEAPKVDAWVDVYGTGVPTSEKYGPRNTDGEYWSCYAHSPTGALFAGAYAVSALGKTLPMTDYWVAEGPGREEGLAELEGTAPDQQANADLRLVGYRYGSYTDDLAVIEYAIEGSNSQGQGYVSGTLRLVWEDDRWKVDTQTFPLEPAPLDPSLPGFTPWTP